jgi:hypothetical protein
MSRTGPILMSGGNPNGHKLEELLETVIAEIQAKNTRVQNDPSSAAQTLLRNNADIIVRLKECRRLQEHSLQELERLHGADQGPTGKPRVGEGS